MGGEAAWEAARQELEKAAHQHLRCPLAAAPCRRRPCTHPPRTPVPRSRCPETFPWVNSPVCSFSPSWICQKSPRRDWDSYPTVFSQHVSHFCTSNPKENKTLAIKKHLAFLVGVGEDLRKAKDTGEGKIKSLIYQVLSLKT